MINLDLTWDVSATLQMIDVNSNVISKKITGRFKPSVATYENIYNLVVALSDLTTNTYYRTTLGATSKDIYYYIANEQ